MEKLLQWHACRLVLVINKAIICRKRFAIEEKIMKTTKIFPFKRFAIYGSLNTLIEQSAFLQYMM